MKRKVFTLEAEEATVSMADTAISFWQTAMVNYEFAHALNRLYDLDLERMNDMHFFDRPAAWPCYHYYDNERKLGFDLLDKPFALGSVNPMFDTSDKIVIVTGQGAWEMATRMAGDSAARMTDNATLARFANEVFTVEVFDFDPLSPHAPKIGTNAYRHYDAVKALCEQIVACLDLNNTLY